MLNWIKDRENKYREFYGLSPKTQLVSKDSIDAFDVSPKIAKHLEYYNIEWHFVPSEESLSKYDEIQAAKTWRTLKRDFNPMDKKSSTIYKAIMNGHGRHQGCIVGVETTQKPKYLPDNEQIYGTHYGFESADPFAPYMRKAGHANGSRFGHNYKVLKKFINLVNKDWNSRSLMPKGFHLTICPPGIFNLIGTIFHPEWSETESLEVGFYLDEKGNALGFAIGSNSPNDFSYFKPVEIGLNWEHIGFRLSLVPDE